MSAHYDESFIEQVRAANPLPAVARDLAGAELEQRGPNDYWALCPFHSETTASWHCSSTEWNDFGSCAEGGDVFAFVQKLHGISFREAVALLAATAGLSPDASASHAPPPRPPGVALRPKVPPATWSPAEAAAMQAGYVEALTPELSAWLANDLGLDEPVLRGFGVGFHRHTTSKRKAPEPVLCLVAPAPSLTGEFTFPMLAADPSIRGFRTRGVNGDKRSIRGSRSGLFYRPEALNGAGLNVLVVEGLSDALAADQLGFAAVGLPSANCGADLLLDLLRRCDVASITVVADNDQAGMSSARAVGQLLHDAGYLVGLIVAPLRAKDLRDAVRAGLTRVDLLNIIEDSATSPTGSGAGA